MMGNSATSVGLYRRRTAAALLSASLLASGWSAPAFAQEQATVAAGDIVVTARKRQESILKVPVVMTAVSDEKIENVGVTQITDLPKLVPGLVIAGNLLSIGPQVTVRGVGTSSFDPGVDQSVSLNLDGLSLGQGLAFGSGMFDVAQVEVLKGPQALFYGKSSPGGVISLRTADPTDKLEVIGRASYEFIAREKRGEAIASGPVTDTLGLRIAAAYSKADGYFINDAVPVASTGALAPDRRESQPKSFILRGTLLWKPLDNFSARLKVNHVYDHAVDSELKQLASCPEGNQAFGFGSGLPGSPIPAAPNFLTPVDPIPFIGGDDCKFNRHLRVVYMDPAAFPGIPNGGTPYLETKQNFGTLELNYDIDGGTRLTSTTAIYALKSSSSVNPTLTTAAAPTFAVTNRFSRDEFTQELRLEHDSGGPLGFTLGAFYEDGRIYDRVHFIRNTKYGFISPGIVGFDILNDDRATTVDIKTYSAFGQLRYKIMPTLEVAGGVRYSDEKRSERVFDFQNNRDLTPTLPVPSIRSKTWSPEVTLTYTPTDDMTIFGSLKKGYKSGSYKLAVPAQAGEDNSFGDEKVKGYEIGLKTRLLDRSLLFNAAFYDYYYEGLQVGAIENSVGGVPIIRTVNAGKARTYGVDLDLAYRPPSVDGLSLNASINWNKARYTKLDNIPCYANQTFAQGCNTFFAPPSGQQLTRPVDSRVTVGGVSGFYNGQDLDGTQMIRAPEWSANFGFDYEMPVGSGLKLRVGNNNSYSSKYPSFLANGRPNNDNFQRGFFKIDASLALGAEDDRWEVALIGKNLTDKLVASNCSPSNTAGGIFLGTDFSGGSRQGTMGYAERLCFADGGGRQIMVRLTLKPFN
jgi:iron complex outermembrane receptor protein